VQLKSKREAAEILGVSTRAVERAVRRGHLLAQYRPGKHGPMAWFSTRDLERYQNLQRARIPVGFTSGFVASHTDAGVTLGAITPLAEHPVRSPDEPANAVSLSQRLVLSLDEAIQLSGLPRQFIVSHVQSRKLKMLKISGEIFVKRADLEAFVRKL